MKNYPPVLLLVLASAVLSGCMTTLTVPAETEPIKPGMARIYFIRDKAALGAAVTHLVVDRCDSTEFDAEITQKKDFPLDKYDFDKAWNVQTIYQTYTDTTSTIIMGKTNRGTFVFAPYFKAAEDSNAKIFRNLDEYLTLLSSTYTTKRLDSMKLNARVVWIVDNGHSITWERPAGYMRLEVITSAGDQAFARLMYVGPGNTYYVIYHYPQARFAFNDMKSFRIKKLKSGQPNNKKTVIKVN